MTVIASKEYNISGIYSITNTINGKKYIGSSKNIYRRFLHHISGLRLNKHPNKHLQAAWNKYGENNFVFQGIVPCELEDLLVFEQQLINTRRPEYNKSLVVGKTNQGRHFSDDIKKKFSMSHLDKGRLDLTGVKLKSPNGTIITNIGCLATFCRREGLCDTHLYKVIFGKRKSHKGWTVCY